MLKQNSFRTTTYETNCHIKIEGKIEQMIIDVVELPDMFECWIYSKSYGMKMHMFGLMKPLNHEYLLGIIEKNLDYYARAYKKEVMTNC